MGERTVEADGEAVGGEGRGAEAVEEPRGRRHRAHCVGRGGAYPDLEHLEDGEEHRRDVAASRRPGKSP